MRRLAPVALALLLLALIVVPAGSTPEGASAADPAPELVHLRVMTFNVREGAKHVSLEAAAEAIRVAEADVVGWQEPFGRTRRLARMLGWYAELARRRRNGLRVNSAVPGARGRTRPQGPMDAAVRRGPGPAGNAEEPAFFTGDLATPSWRDWTPRVVRALGWLPRSLRAAAAGPRYSARWPVSLLLEEAGFRDSYREAPGNRYDWLSLNLAGADPERDALYGWRYVGGRFEWTVAFRSGSFGNWPLRPGRYQVSLCVDDAYRRVATSRPFRVTAVP